MDHRDIMTMTDRAFRVLVFLWLLASEDEGGRGELPPIDDIAFRTRISAASITKSLEELSAFVCHGDITGISSRHRGGPSETETETETEKHFDVFWFEYPKKTGKKAARAAWDKAKDKPRIDAIVRAIKAAKRSEQWRKDGGKFIPYPATWLNRGCWDDEITDTTDKTGRSHVSRKVTICGGCGADCSASFTYRDGVPLCDGCYEGGS
jgi:hypothetical protein